jgi:hypothetical protein
MWNYFQLGDAWQQTSFHAYSRSSWLGGLAGGRTDTGETVIRVPHSSKPGQGAKVKRYETDFLYLFIFLEYMPYPERSPPTRRLSFLVNSALMMYTKYSSNRQARVNQNAD